MDGASVRGAPAIGGPSAHVAEFALKPIAHLLVSWTFTGGGDYHVIGRRTNRGRRTRGDRD